jgi:endonuclease/exonuclease/phosphatase (EEP) superfamily protein YafD
MKKLLVLSLLISVFISNTVLANRQGLAKQYSIPSLNQSHLILGKPQQRELNPNSIKILVWNLLKAERENWSRDFMSMAKDNDILLLQEGYLNQTMEDAFSNLTEFQFDFGVSFLYKKDQDTPTGTAVGSRVEPEQSGLLRTKEFEPLIKTPKTITYGYYPIANSNESLLVLSIHGLNFTKHNPFVRQIEEALNVLDQHEGPIVFAGDFNTRTKKRMGYLRHQMVKRGFKEVEFNNDKRMKVLGHYLDHAFIKKMLVRRARVLGEIKTSDHKPLELDLVVDK